MVVFIPRRTSVPWRSEQFSLILRQLCKCFSSEQPSQLRMQQKCFLCTSHMVTKSIKKTCTQGLRFNKIEIYIIKLKYIYIFFTIHQRHLKLAIFYCECVVVKSTVIIGTVQCHSLDSMLTCQQFCPPLLLPHQCRHQHSITITVIITTAVTMKIVFTLSTFLPPPAGSAGHTLRTTVVEKQKQTLYCENYPEVLPTSFTGSDSNNQAAPWSRCLQYHFGDRERKSFCYEIFHEISVQGKTF